MVTMFVLVFSFRLKYITIINYWQSLVCSIEKMTTYTWRRRLKVACRAIHARFFPLRAILYFIYTIQCPCCSEEMTGRWARNYNCAQDVGKKGQSARQSAFVYAGIISLVNKIYNCHKNYQLEYVWLIVVFHHFNAFYTYSLLQVLMSICLLLDTYSYNLKHWTKAPTRKSIRIWHVQRTQPIFNSFLTPSLTQ